MANDGGPAFPNTTYDEIGATDHQGMTLRDYFAAQALTVVHDRGGRYNEHGLKAVTEQAYAVADAMLAARKAS